jgi:hypothetical protein
MRWTTTSKESQILDCVSPSKNRVTLRFFHNLILLIPSPGIDPSLTDAHCDVGFSSF